MLTAVEPNEPLGTLSFISSSSISVAKRIFALRFLMKKLFSIYTKPLVKLLAMCYRLEINFFISKGGLHYEQ